jgi:hypothetical protein
MVAEESRAGGLEDDLATHHTRVFASGLRKPNGLSWNPELGAELPFPDGRRQCLRPFQRQDGDAAVIETRMGADRV